MNLVKLRFQDGFGVVLMYIWIIELIWVSTYGKNGRKTHILGIFRGAVSVLVMLCFSVLTSVRILEITCSFPIRFE